MTSTPAENPSPADQSSMALGTAAIVFLFLYYACILFGAATAGWQLQTSSTAARDSLHFCLSLSLVGSSVFYSRKLYKACISSSYNFDSGSLPQKIGTFFFFLLRPLFALAFAWITHMIWEATIISSVDNFTRFSPTHLYLSGVLGFFVGFLAGRVLTRMEAVGEKHLNGVW